MLNETLCFICALYKAQGCYYMKYIIKYLLCILPPISNESPVARLVVVHTLFLSPLYYRVVGHVVLIHQMLNQLLNYIGLLDSESQNNKKKCLYHCSNQQKKKFCHEKTWK